jgi:hypothetical protein
MKRARARALVRALSSDHVDSHRRFLMIVLRFGQGPPQLVASFVGCLSHDSAGESGICGLMCLPIGASARLATPLSGTFLLLSAFCSRA